MRGFDFDFFEEELINTLNHVPSKSFPQLIIALNENEIKQRATRRAINYLVNRLSEAETSLDKTILKL
jgi:hypothetical protein